MPAARPATPPARLAIEGVAVRRGHREVLRGVSLEVRPGEIFGLLGPNGAGKSTLFAILAGLLRPDAGRFLLDGRAIAPGARSLRSAAGIVFQDPGLDGKLTAAENLRLGAALHRVPRREVGARVAALLEEAALADRAREPVDRLSGGMRRRLELARARIHEPPLLVMDEPTSGLDAAAFRAFWARVAALRREAGTTVVLTTHRPDEAERCDRLAVLARGRIVACDTPEALRARVSGDVVVVEADDPEAIAADIGRRLGLPARVRADGVHVEREAAHELVPRIVEAFPAGRLRSVSVRRPTLADAYLAITGEALEEQPAAEEDAAGRTDRRRAVRAVPAATSTATSTSTSTPTATATATPRPVPRAPGLPILRALAFDLATVAVLARRDLVRFFRQPSRLVGALGQPVIFWLVIGSGFGETFRMPGSSVPYLAYFFPGVVLMVVLFASIFTTASVIEDRHRGFLQSVLAAPGSRVALAVGKTLGSAAVALTQAALFLALAPLAGFGYASVHWPLLLGALALAAVALAALGFAVAWGLDNVQGYHAIQMTLLVPLWVVSGAMFPAPSGTGALAAVMRANPLAYAVSAARRALGGPAAPGALAGSGARDLAVCALFTAAALALGALATRRAPRS
ncbi:MULTISPECIES: ABC transporter ATP-binding protein/permease [Anaeromyxobacter]|uniref:ABC transporter ATP-binding protein/permease n=1 Tax=Anaeromyxobacter TaxID=161492 RepID=UPI001F5A4FEA|nr:MULTISPECIES: ABC transporter ATP-binding protein/permease [unclassified Anaeromyxobacter]